MIPLPPATVKLLSDKVVEGLDRETGKKCYYMVYTVEHEGMEKQYTTRLKSKNTGEVSYFVQTMAQLGAGSVVKLEMKRAGMQNYIDIEVITHVPEELALEDEPVDPAEDVEADGDEPVIEA